MAVIRASNLETQIEVLTADFFGAGLSQQGQRQRIQMDR